MVSLISSFSFVCLLSHYFTPCIGFTLTPESFSLISLTGFRYRHSISGSYKILTKFFFSFISNSQNDPFYVSLLRIGVVSF